MKARLVVIGIDDICRLFRDYTRLIDFPEDAQCDTLLFDPASKRMCLRIKADSLNGPQPAENINFQLQRTFRVN